MAASGVAVFDNTDLGRYPFRHGIGVTDDTDLFALRSLQHSQRVDDRGKRVGVESAETLVNKQILERDTS